MNIHLSKSSSWYYAGLILLAFLALLQAIVIWHLEPMLSRDGTFYARQVTEKVQDGISFYHADFAKPPFFLLCACGICRAAGVSAERSLIILNAVCLALMVFSMAGIARRVLHSSVASFFCAAWLVTSPVLFQTVRGGTREPLFLCLLLFSTVAAFLFFEKHSPLWLGVSAVCGMLSALTRFEGLFGLIAIFLCVVLRVAGPGTGKKCLFQGGIFAGIAVATLGSACLLSQEILLFMKRMLELFGKMGMRFQ